MFILGMLAVFQITFLPGIILYKIFKVNKGLINSLVFTFGLSLIANYVGIFLLTAVGMYTTTVVYIIFSIEVILALWLYRDAFSISLGKLSVDIVEKLENFLSSFDLKNQKDDPKKTVANVLIGGVYVFFIIMAFSSVWWIIRFWWNNLGNVFSMWDPVVQWNAWANAWFQNTIPLGTNLYPQLIPVNFSLPYIFMGDSQLQLFTTGFIPLFSIFILLIMLDLGFRYRKIGYFIAVVITRFLLKKFYFLHIGDGFVDLPLAFFSLISIYCLIIAENEKNEDTARHMIWLGAIFTAGASVTKQSGLYLFALYPILVYFIVLHKSESVELKEKLKIALTPSLSLLLIVLPGYVLAQYNTIIGVNESNAWGVFIKHYGELNLLERIPPAMASLEIYAYLYLILVLTIPLLNSAYRWIALTIVFPYTLIWTMLLSYSHRNLSLAIPILGLTVGMGIGRGLDLFRELLSRIRLNRMKAVIFPIVIALGIFGLSLYLTDSVLIDQQTEEQKGILFSSINKKLYAFFPEEGPDEKILTRYPIRYLPGFEDSQIQFRFETYSGYIEMREKYPDVKLLLIEKKADKQIIEELYENIEMGNYKLIFDDYSYLFIQILTEE